MDFNNQYSQGRYIDTGEEYEGHDCYIDGIECIAFEDRFGGNFIYVASILRPPATGQSSGQALRWWLLAVVILALLVFAVF